MVRHNHALLAEGWKGSFHLHWENWPCASSHSAAAMPPGSAAINVTNSCYKRSMFTEKSCWRGRLNIVDHLTSLDQHFFILYYSFFYRTLINDTEPVPLVSVPWLLRSKLDYMAHVAFQEWLVGWQNWKRFILSLDWQKELFSDFMKWGPWYLIIAKY